jgi:DNA-binding transcriptional ArsR family regulator
MPHRNIARHELVDLFAVLAHPLRLGLVLELKDGERDVTALIHATGASQTAVSQSLSRLRTARLVAVRRDGRHLCYRLTLDNIANWLDDAFALLEDETAQLASVHDAIALTRKDLHGERS